MVHFDLFLERAAAKDGVFKPHEAQALVFALKFLCETCAAVRRRRMRPTGNVFSGRCGGYFF
jgi:hypothetical protein